MVRAATAIACLVAGAALLRAQGTQTPPPPQDQRPPVFRGRVETVAVPVTVFDPENTLITSLTRDDFAVFDNEKRQEITQFSSGLQPIRAVVLVDSSASMTPALDLALTAAEQFIIRLRPEDKAKAGLFNARVSLNSEFTSNRDTLLGWLRREVPFSNPTKLLDAVNEAVTTLSTETGRRVVMVFTDGCDTASETSWTKLLNRIYLEDTMVYTILFRPNIVLKAPPQQTLSFGSASSMYGGSNRNSGGILPACSLHHWLELPSGTPVKDYFKADDPRWTRGPQLVTQLASETGGGRIVLTPANDVNSLFTAIMNELHYLYLLGFTPQTADGKVHEIVVRVNDRKLIVRARQHYLAPPPPPPTVR